MIDALDLRRRGWVPLIIWLNRITMHGGTVELANNKQVQAAYLGI